VRVPGARLTDGLGPGSAGDRRWRVSHQPDEARQFERMIRSDGAPDALCRRPMKRRFGPLALMAWFGFASLACGESRLLDGFTEGQTRLRLVPSEFTGNVICEKGTPNALQSYVVRLEALLGAEVDAGLETAFTSGPIPCDQAVVFATVGGRLYSAEVFGFDVAVPATNVDVSLARWTSVCGRGRSSLAVSDAGLDPLRPTYSFRGATVPIRGCTAFGGDANGEGASQLLVDQASALNGRACGQGADQVYAFQATLGRQTLLARCGEPLSFVVDRADRYYQIDLVALQAGADAGAGDGGLPSAPASSPADAGVDASVDALDASVSEPIPTPRDAGAQDAGARDAGAPVLGGVPRWRTRCIGRALPGVTVPAYCDPLAPLP
jgi:hypothetical protein